MTIGAGSGISINALANGMLTTAVSWQLSSAVGTISSSGFYQAPSQVAAPTTVQVVARWNNNNSIFATAQITVNPIVSISVTPSAYSIQTQQTAQFTAVVNGTSNKSVVWRLTPNLGSISNGVYQAPSSVSSPTSVLVTAISVADPNRFAAATVQVNPPPTPTTTQTLLPIEVLGPNGTTKTATFTLSATQAAAAQNLYLQIHDLDYQGEGSVQINDAAWIPLNETNYRLFKLDAAYGGIGGGFGTIRGRVPVQPAWFRTGTNTIRFRFNQTNGVTHGYRVLNLNLENLAGANLLPSSTFIYDNPSTWTPPLSDSTSIAQGKFLWYNAQLSTPLAPSIRARCSDCHAQDGRDLKYFNYSNYSIRTRAQFHGLSETQGNQIASYIRSLASPAPGRPWNPPYQPGPGMDARPISEWSAGAGLTAVLDRDRDTLNSLFPNGFEPSRIMPSANLSAREVPVAIQLPDWNRWLPEVHPKDAFAGFDASGWNQAYLKIRSGLIPGQVSSFLNLRFEIALWPVRAADFLGPILPGGGYGTWTAQQIQAHYAARLWQMTKRWELAQEFG
jgi:cytochrome c553